MVSDQPAVVFQHLLHALIPQDSTHSSSLRSPQGIVGGTFGQLSVPKSLWLLCSILMYGEKQLGECSVSRCIKFIQLIWCSSVQEYTHECCDRYCSFVLDSLSEPQLHVYLLVLYSLVGELSVVSPQFDSRTMNEDSESDIDMEDVEEDTIVSERRVWAMGYLQSVESYHLIHLCTLYFDD